jgi:hypothetical protein
MRTLTKITALAVAGLILSTAAASADDDCHFHWVVGQGFTLECDGNSITIPGGGMPGATPKVCFFKGNNYTGQMACVNAGTSDAHVPLNWNNKVSSLKVFGGAKVRLFKHYNFTGPHNVFSGNVPVLGAMLNDQASSYQTW